MARPSSALLRAALLVCVCAVSVAAYSRFQSAYKYLDRVDIMVNSIGTLAGPSADTALPIARIRLLGTLVQSNQVCWIFVRRSRIDTSRSIGSRS